MGATLFTASAVANLAAWQRANMPDRALVFRRVLTRQPGGVMLEAWTYARTEPCRLSLSRATERNTGGTLGESRTWILARPQDAAPLDGTETVVVFGGKGTGVEGAPFSVALRVVAVAGPRTFRTVQKADVSTDGAPALLVGTTRAAGPVSLAWSTAITVTNGA